MIKRQVQLGVTIDKNTYEFPFLIVPNLSADMLVGMDWLDNFRVTIEVGSKRIKLADNYLPSQIVTFRAASSEKSMCRMIKLGTTLWYKGINIFRGEVKGNEGRSEKRGENGIVEKSVCQLGSMSKQVVEGEYGMGKESEKEGMRECIPVAGEESDKYFEEEVNEFIFVKRRSKVSRTGIIIQLSESIFEGPGVYNNI